MDSHRVYCIVVSKRYSFDEFLNINISYTFYTYICDNLKTEFIILIIVFCVIGD